MAEFYALPVYKKALDLERQFRASTKRVPREVKYSHIDRMEDNLIEIIATIAFAGSFGETRAAFINAALTEMKRFKIRVRVLHDLGFISKVGFGAIIKEEEELCRQLNGWMKSTNNVDK